MLGQSNTNTIATYIKIENEDITVTQNGVYEAGEEYTGLGTVTVQVDSVNNQEKSIAPTTSEQIVTPDQGYTGLSSVTVGAVTNAIDNNIQAGNIKSGVNILGITGNVVELNATPTTITPTTSEQTITPQGAYNGFSTITVDPVTSSIDSNITPSNIVDGVTILGVQGSAEALNGETITVTPTTSQQVITPTSPHNGIIEVTVDGVTSSIDSNIAAENIKSGVSILGVSGTVTELNGTTLNVTPTASSQSHTPFAPNNAYTQVTVDGDANLVAGNIVKDVTIFGVTGNYEGQVINNQNKTVTENGIYNADEGYTGLGDVTVNVQPPLKDETITQNGVYDLSSEIYLGINITEKQAVPTLIGDHYWLETDDIQNIQIGDLAYNGKLVNGKVIPDKTNVIDTIRDFSHHCFVEYNFAQSTRYRIYPEELTEYNGHYYFKVDAWWKEDITEVQIIGDYIWVDANSIENIHEGTAVYNSIDAQDTAPNLNDQIGTIVYVSPTTSIGFQNYQYGIDYPSDNDVVFSWYGYDEVTVNVPSDINNQNKTADTDGVYSADLGYSGLGQVTVTAGAVVSAEIEAQLHEINSGTSGDESGDESAYEDPPL